MEVYHFNPDSDLALADFTESYMAPALIRQMAEDMALLPMWYAVSGSGVLAASAYNLSFFQEMSQHFSLNVSLCTWPELTQTTDLKFHPWGWNPTEKKHLMKAGVPNVELPSMEELTILRKWSGRETALQILQAFQGVKDCCGTGVCLFSVEDCESYWKQLGKQCVFKAPWSGSGKGLLWCCSDFSDSVSGWCARILSTQGTLIGMPIYNKVYDFAMEFFAKCPGAFSFMGYSHFETNGKGAYLGNTLDSNEEIEKELSTYVSLFSLREVQSRLLSMLGSVYTSYQGYLGVDMMVCSLEDGTYAIFPCVEVNLRMNMGLVARIFYDRFMQNPSKGVFKVEAFTTSKELQKKHETDSRLYPAVIQNGKLMHGYLPLVPVTSHSRYRAFVYVE